MRLKVWKSVYEVNLYEMVGSLHDRYSEGKDCSVEFQAASVHVIAFWSWFVGSAMLSRLIDVGRSRTVGVFWFPRRDLEQKLLWDGSVEARTVAVVLLDQWAGGSTHSRESGGEQDRFNHCCL
jgi:hypothetical protein